MPTVKDRVLSALVCGEKLAPLEIAKRSGCNYNTTRRCLGELLKEGRVEKSAGIYWIKENKPVEAQQPVILSEPTTVEQTFASVFSATKIADGVLMSSDGTCMLITNLEVDASQLLNNTKKVRLNIAQNSLNALAKRNFTLKFGESRINPELLSKAIQVFGGKSFYMHYNLTDPTKPIMVENGKKGKILIAPVYEELTVSLDSLVKNITATK